MRQIRTECDGAAPEIWPAVHGNGFAVEQLVAPLAAALAEALVPDLAPGRSHSGTRGT